MLPRPQVDYYFPDLRDPTDESRRWPWCIRASAPHVSELAAGPPYRYISHTRVDQHAAAGNINWMQPAKAAGVRPVRHRSQTILLSFRDLARLGAMFYNVLEMRVMTGARCRTRI